MNRIAVQKLQHSLVVFAAVALLAACNDDAPLGPDSAPAFVAPLASVEQHRAPDLGSCVDSLALPVQSKVTFRAFAKGAQIYTWTGTSWTLAGPSAVLYEAPTFRGVVGTHYFGPTWESNSGSKVAAAVAKRCTPDANAVPWLLLSATSSEGPGPFARTTYIHRVNTVGGVAPSAPGTIVGEQKSVPYTTEYYFYRSEWE
jgi:hypothetical protein